MVALTIICRACFTFEAAVTGVYFEQPVIISLCTSMYILFAGSAGGRQTRDLTHCATLAARPKAVSAQKHRDLRQSAQLAPTPDTKPHRPHCIMSVPTDAEPDPQRSHSNSAAHIRHGHGARTYWQHRHVPPAQNEGGAVIWGEISDITSVTSELGLDAFLRGIT